MPSLPAGTVTFLLTDIEDSSRQWEESPAAMQSALAAHDAIVSTAIKEYDGVVVKHLGDGCWAAFASAPSAAAAAIELQRRLQKESRDLAAQLEVRIGLHTGEVEPTDDDYFGPVPNRAARVVDLANGNQIVCSSSTAGLLPQLDLRSDGLHELRGIGVEEIFIIHADGLEVDPRPLRRPVAPSTLPRSRTSFLGRDEDVKRTTGFVESHAGVVTLVGPGGVGKTRLAIEVGAQLARSGAATVQFCDLSTVGDADGIAAVVADVVGARQQPGMSLVASIADYLGGRQVVLILDNCEHVVELVRDLVERLMSAEGVRFLATSREGLGLPGEQVVIVSPLPADTAAVELFVDRARHRDPRFELTGSNESAVREIVRRLDGIPLAIELAAARIRLMTPAEMADRLDDRFQLLRGGGERDHHQTLHDTVAWSFNLLSPAEAALFTRLSVFAGGFDLEAAERVCGGDELIPEPEVADLVLALVDKSMVVSKANDGRQRFSMLETLRGFGQHELTSTGAAERYRCRHADHYRELARQQGDRMFGAAEPDAWRILDVEWPNLRTALDSYEAAGDIDPAAELVVALVWYAAMSMRFELFGWAEELLTAPGIEAHPAYTDLCGAAALGAYFTVDGRVAELAEAGLAADPADPQGLCRTALAALFLNNLHTAEASDQLTSAWLASEPVAIGSRLWAEAFRTFHLCLHDPSPEAAAHAAVTMELAKETGSITARAVAAWARGQVVSFEDLEKAIDIWTEGLEWPRSMPGDHLIEHLLIGLILHFTVRRGELLDVLERCRDAVSGALDRHYYAGTSHLFGVVAIALSRAGDAATGARLVGAMIANGHQPRDNARRALEAALGEDVEHHLALGASLSVTQAGHLAIAALAAAVERTDNGR